MINRIRNQYPEIAYFQYWHSWSGAKVAIVDDQNASALLNDPWVITRDEVDWRSEPSPSPTPPLTPTPTPPPNPYDLDGNDKVNAADVLIFLGN